MKVALLLADGFETIEASAPYDILVRAGCKVIPVGVGTKDLSYAESAQGLAVKVEMIIEEASTEQFDCIILPGGMPGSKTLAADSRVQKLVTQQIKSNKWVAAICAAPAHALAATGLMEHHKGTCYPTEAKLMGDNYIEVSGPVHVDGKFVTSKGPGTAVAFGLRLAALLVGEDVAIKIKNGMIYDGDY